jgi:hypothetical protein
MKNDNTNLNNGEKELLKTVVNINKKDVSELEINSLLKEQAKKEQEIDRRDSAGMIIFKQTKELEDINKQIQAYNNNTVSHKS